MVLFSLPTLTFTFAAWEHVMSRPEDENKSPKDKSENRFRKWIYFVLGGIGATFLGTVVGLVTATYIEISFKGLSVETLTQPSRWTEFHIDFIRPEVFHAYYEDDEGGEPILRDAVFYLRFFDLTKKIVGEKVRPDGYTFSIVGFWKDERIVLDHRGNASGGEGAYILRLFQNTEISGRIFAGYVLPESWKRVGSSDDWILKCPFLMLPEDVAHKRYGDRVVLLHDFPFLTTKCTEFAMPTSLTDPVAVASPASAAGRSQNTDR